MLSQKNKHERDDRISFDEPTHTYFVDGSSDGIISTTTLIHENFPKFDANKVLKFMKNKKEKYPNMTDQQIKESWNENGKKTEERKQKFTKTFASITEAFDLKQPYTYGSSYGSIPSNKDVLIVWKPKGSRVIYLYTFIKRDYAEKVVPTTTGLEVFCRPSK